MAETWTVQVTLGGVRYTMSSGTRDRRRAERMAAMLRTLYAERRTNVLDRLRGGDLGLPDVFALFARADGALQGRLEALEAERLAAARPSLGVLVSEWGAWLRSGPISRRSGRPIALSTARRYLEGLGGVLRALGEWEALEPTALTAATLKAYRVARQSAGITPSTVNRDLLAVSAFFDWLARERGILLPRPEMQREREPRGRDRWLTAEELRRVEAAFQDLNGGFTQVRGRRKGGKAAQGIVPTRHWWPFYALLAQTGMRLGEALALQWEDVRFTERVIEVRRGMGAGGRLKSYGSVRRVPLSGYLAAQLTTHRATFATVEEARVFPAVAFSARRMQDLWGRAMRAAKLPHARVHDLRHTFAVHALEAGVQVNDLQSLLGHSDAMMVLRYVRRQSEGKTAAIGDQVSASLLGEVRPQEEAAAQAARERFKVG
jgi:integrase